MERVDLMKHVALLLSLMLFTQFSDARPKIGLALSGGGAKGAAHVGVLKVLQQHNVPIDYIAGTSIGSVVGGMYATGMTIDEIEKVMLETPWADGYSDRIPRENLSWRDKRQSDQFNIPLELGIDDDQLKIPDGLLYGQGVTRLLREAVGEHPNFDSFDELAIPFRAIATNLVNHEAVVINKGSLLAAMRASSSVPGVLAPESIDGLLLVDGGITKNLPVDVVQAMGADVVIAVNIGSGLKSKEELEGTFAIIEQLSAFLTTSASNTQKNLLSEHDLLIEPNIIGLSTTNWSILQEALIRGESAAYAQSAKLAAFSLSDDVFNEYLQGIHEARVRLLSRTVKPVVHIELSKTSAISDGLILQYLDLSVGKKIDGMEINTAVDRLFSMNEFQSVDAFTTLVDNEKVLNVIAQDKSWGPNFLQFGIGWEDDLDNNSDLNFDIAYTLGNLTNNGGEWRSEVEMGTRRSIKTEFYQPLDRYRNFYSNSRYAFRSFGWDVFIKGAPRVPIDQQYHSIFQGIGYNYIQQGFTEVGLTGEVGRFNDSVLIKGSIDYFTYGAYWVVGFDTLDSINFPTQGSYFKVSSFLRNEEVDEHTIITREDDIDQIVSLVIDVSWKGALKFENQAIVAKTSYSEVFTQGDNESIYISYLGGFLNLSGYHKEALTGAKKAFAAGVYQFDLGRSLLNIEQFPLYLGLSIEIGNVWQEGEDIDPEDLIIAGSSYLGTDTSLGPVALGYGRTNNNEQAFYFYLGKNF